MIAQLLKYGQEYSPGILPVRTVVGKSTIKQQNNDTPVSMSSLSKAVLAKKVDFTLPIRVHERSSLNLAFGKGRLTRPKIGKPFYIPRPYYEVEITLPREFWVPPLTNFVPNSLSQPVEFMAYTDNGMCFSCNFNRKHGGKKDKRPLHEIGGDFQSTPREALGRYIKDKFIQEGVMNYGEPITEDTLSYFGRSEIKVRMLDEKTIHLEF